MWSGSVLPGKTSANNTPYSGVGLELYQNANNYFRYSTSDNLLDINTQTFILGTYPGTYIYGSALGLAISSSNFALDFAGNVTMSGTITATAGNIGGFTINTNALSNANNFYISGAATGNGFFISSSKFNVKANGDITGSNVLFTGGKIGGFTISNNTLSNANNFYISGAASGNDFFISSSKFNVKANGDVTGSQVLFTGGKIAGFTISDNTLSNSSNFFISGSASGNDFFISSSKFNVKANGDVTASSALFSGSVSITGNINATTGNIGGFAITRDAITGSGFFLSGSATGNGFFISSSNFNVKASGDITASNALFSGNVSAVNFSKKMVTVTNDNSGSYFQTVTGGINLIFDGSLPPGETTMVMEIACPTNPTLNIKNIQVPNTGSGLMPQVEVIISQNNVTFDTANIKIGTALAVRTS